MNNKRKDYIWNTLGVFLQSAISPLLLIVVTRVNGIDASGVFSFAMAVAVVFWTVSMWGGRTYQVSDTLGSFSNISYVGLRILTSTILIFTTLFFCLANGYDSEKSAVIISLVSMKLMESIADPLYGIMQTRGDLYKSGVSLTLKFVLCVILFTAINMLGGGVVLASASLVFAQIIIFIIYDLPLVVRVRRFNPLTLFRKTYLKEIAKIMKITSPFFLGLLFVSLSLNIPRYVLDLFHESQSGFFGIMAMPITVLFLFASFIIQPNVVELANYYANARHREFNGIVVKIFQTTSIIGILAVILTYLIGVQIMALVFGVDLSEYRLAFTVLVIGAMFNVAVSLFVNIFTVMRSYSKIIGILVWTNIIGAILSIVIISKYALLGASVIFAILSLIQASAMVLIYIKSISTSQRFIQNNQ